ncbi:MAG TPA: TIR domain-containing protein [Candidatus Kapabacteria bacterium]|jgi:TolB-like protein
MAELFISYSKHNRPQALDLADELRAKGFSVWIDQGGIEGAQNWSARIVEGIADCSTLVLLISPQAVASRNVAREVHIAYEKSKNILPVVIEKVTLPANFQYSLAGIQHVYYSDRPAILQALEKLRSGVPTTEELSSFREDDIIRVAVLPFDDLSPQHDNQWFADGMMDELISTLGLIDRVKVPPRSDVRHYRDHRAKNREIARDLGVRYLIDGAVRKAGERIRINATLIDARQNEQLWGNQFNGTFDDVFAFQESVSKHIADALKLTLTPEEEHQIEDHGTQNAEAYALFLKGKHEQYYYTKASYLRALEFYEQAAALDPKFERAHIGIASICCVYYREYSKSPQWLKRAQESLAKAEAINGETSKTLYTRGVIEWLKGNSTLALKILKSATELDPKHASAFNILGTIYLENDDFVAAVAAFRRVTELFGGGCGDFFNLLCALESAGDQELLLKKAEEALPLYDRYLLQEPTDFNAAVSRSLVLFWSGRNAESAEAADKLKERDDLSGYSLYMLGLVFNKLGKPQLFLDLLHRAIDHGYREIGATRSSFRSEDPELQEQFEQAIQRLDALIEAEMSPIPS